MGRRKKSKLIPYVQKLKCYTSDVAFRFRVQEDKNLKVLSIENTGEDTLFWIEGFNERKVFFLKENHSGKLPYFYLSYYYNEDF